MSSRALSGNLSRVLGWAAGLPFAVGLLVLWWAVAEYRLVSPVYLPGPERTFDALMRAARSGMLAERLAGTLQRMAVGWLLASAVGVALGLLIGLSPRARAYLGTSLELIRPLPASAVIPVAIAYLGLSEGMVLSVIAFGAAWPMLLATVHGVAAVEPRLREVSGALGLGRLAFVRKIALPSALPDILAGMRLGLTVSLILTIVGEMLASRNGLGQWILLAGRSFRSADLFAGVLMLSAIGLVTNGLLTLVERRLLRWRGDVQSI